MGEGMANDEAIMPFISSANIACGYHAGDESTIKKTMELALQHNVAIGAHPGFADKENFGRLEIFLSQPELYDLVVKQVHLVKNICSLFNTKLHHVKPHGALYNMAAKDKALAATIAKAVKDVDDTLVLYGLHKSCMLATAAEIQVKTASEVFADRRYNNNGSLVSRALPGALIETEEDALGQVLQMVLHNTVTAINGENIPVLAQTICIHGDSKNAGGFSRKIYEALQQHNIIIQTI